MTDTAEVLRKLIDLGRSLDPVAIPAAAGGADIRLELING